MNNISATATPETLFLDDLRNQTDSAHKNLESLPVSASILQSSVTKEQYALYLNLMYDVVKSIEKNIFPLIASVIPDLEQRTKSGFIENDLEHTQIPLRKGPDVFTQGYDLPFALGIAYVVEGSTLGGRFIFKNIEAALGYTQENGASYFYGYGNATGSTWKRFLEPFTHYAVNSGQQDKIIAGANYAFEKIREHLSAAPGQ